MWDCNSTAYEIEASGCKIAVLPVGSTEQHGRHLPIGTDTFTAQYFGTKIAERFGGFLLPALPVSTCREHRGIKGSVWMKPDTFYNMLRDIVQCLKEQGFTRVIVVIGHGGVFIAPPAIREINAEDTGIQVIKADITAFMAEKAVQDLLECKNNLHACELETSIMLYLHGELVKKDMAADCVPDAPRDYLNYFPLLKLSEHGVWGRPTLATREKGEAACEILTQLAVAYVEKLLAIFDGEEETPVK